MNSPDRTGAGLGAGGRDGGHDGGVEPYVQDPAERVRAKFSAPTTAVTECCPDYCSCRPGTQVNLGALACLFVSVVCIALVLMGDALRGSSPLYMLPAVALGSGAIMCLRMPSSGRRRKR